MNRCPDTETVLTFAENPLQEKNAAIAAHIVSCPACQENFRIALDVLASPPVPVTAEDKAEAERVVMRVKNARRRQTKLKETIKFLCTQLEKASIVLVDPKSLPWFEGEGSFVFAAKKRDSFRPSAPSTGDAAFTILFVSCRDENSPYYWKAELSLPRLLHERAVIPFKVTGQNGRELARAKLIYLGIELPVSNGKAELTAQKFKDCLNGHGISVVFEDGTVVNGDILI